MGVGMLRRLILQVGVAAILVIGVAVVSDGAPASAGPAPWRVVPSSNTASNQENTLRDISCARPRVCSAVGYYSAGGTYRTLAEEWNGSTWTVVPSANTSTTQNNFLVSVSCTSPSACTAVGYQLVGATDQTLIESWNGSAWTVVPSPDTSTTQQNALSGVSCSGPRACSAVGEYAASGLYRTLAEEWDGSAWTIVPSANTSSTEHNQLFDVSCGRPRSCTAVGYTTSTGFANRALIETWDGSTWTVVPGANTSTTQSIQLFGVSCRGRRTCIAVGDTSGGTSIQTLVESWNGSLWSIAPSPGVPAQDNFFLSASCITSTACTAVGYHGGPGARQTLIETWDGSTWAIVASPDPGSYSTLGGVSCRGRNHPLCFAVGTYRNGSPLQTLAETND